MTRSPALAKLERISKDMAARPQVIDEARQDNCTWDEIAAAAGMSRAGVIKLRNSRPTEVSVVIDSSLAHSRRAPR